ncbi:hypothetical protein [Mesorhizobium sp.]|uniref:hypothetical protein n=1 Tax=Mesorhizobium sp. TaxID=1871066 RepID=UPI000FE7F077|nr:hypothetical protein [Mesorhizobium sp.]RWD78296.1 MAG: hypothetical protein EOS48_24805 [Mesorhizobium sp.]
MGQGNKGRGKDESRDGPVLQASGGYADVWLFGESLQCFLALATSTGDQDALRASVNLPAYFQRFADKGPIALTEKMFKKLGSAKDGNGNAVPVFEFKNYQVRIYGVIREYRGKRAFIGTACDPKKKQQKADQAMIKRAAEQAGKVK